MIRIVVSRSGGFAGITRTWAVEVTEAEAEQRWLPLLEGVEDTNDDDDGRDRYVYHITVGYREVTLAERTVHGPWQELLDRVRETDNGPA